MCELLHYFAGFPKRCKSMVGSVKKAPLCWRGQGDSHAARAAGWYPAPAHIPNSGRWNWFQMVVRLRLFLGRAGTVWRCPALLLREGAPHTLSPPEWPPPRAEAKDKKVRAPPARASPNGPGGPQHRLPTVQNYFDIGNATQASLTAAKASEFSGSRRKSESDSGAGGKKSKVLLLGPMAKKQGFVARSPCWLVHNIMPCRPTR
jgi:hypothetical protein